MSLLPVYARLTETHALPESLWDEWLWRTDPEERYHADVLLNRCQLLGLMVCLYKGLSEPDAPAPVDRASRLSIMEKPAARMSLRELKDTVENLQVEWPAFLERLPANPNAQTNLDAVLLLIDQCAARFGVLASQAGPLEVMDDPSSVDPARQPDSYRLTHACIRRMVCTFLILYRHLHLLAVARPAPEEYCDVGLTKYHMEASQDDFNLLSMHLALPVAAKLNYKHDYPEMYNHVSQAVFFHNPEYQRTPRAALDSLPAAPVAQVLPAIWQLHPEIRVCYEEDRLDLSSPGTDWVWLVVAGRVYLVTPARQVWHSASATSLLRHVYLRNGQGRAV